MRLYPLLRSYTQASRSDLITGDGNREAVLQGWAREDVAGLLLGGRLHAGVTVALRNLFVSVSVHTAKYRILRPCKDKENSPCDVGL